MYKRIFFFSDIFLCYFFEMDSPETINALLGFSSYFDSSTDVCLLHRQTGTVYIYIECRHRVLPLSLACRIMAHGTQKHH